MKHQMVLSLEKKITGLVRTIKHFQHWLHSVLWTTAIIQSVSCLLVGLGTCAVEGVLAFCVVNAMVTTV